MHVLACFCVRVLINYTLTCIHASFHVHVVDVRLQRKLRILPSLSSLSVSLSISLCCRPANAAVSMDVDVADGQSGDHKGSSTGPIQSCPNLSDSVRLDRPADTKIVSLCSDLGVNPTVLPILEKKCKRAGQLASSPPTQLLARPTSNLPGIPHRRRRARPHGSRPRPPVPPRSLA
jgi:hypothetical protein